MLLTVNTSDILTPQQRLYLPLICELMTESAIFRDGIVIPYEEVVRDLSNDTISAGAGIGVSNQFRQIVTLALKLEETKYLTGIRWLKELIWETQFTEERVKVIVKRMISDLVLAKRKGQTVAGDLLRSMTHDGRSNDYASGIFRQHVFLTSLSDALSKEADVVVKEIRNIRDKIVMDLSNIRVHVSCNMDHIRAAHVGEDVIAPWHSSFLPKKLRQTLPAEIVPAECRRVEMAHELVTPDSNPRAVVAGLGSIESCFLQQCVLSIKSMHHEDLPAVFVLIQYLTQLEGPMWKQIRGPGLSYGFAISLPVTSGLMYFTLTKAAQLVEAYQRAIEIISDHISGKEKWEEGLLESARASLIFELIERQNSIPRVSAESLLSYLKGEVTFVIAQLHY